MAMRSMASVSSQRNTSKSMSSTLTKLVGCGALLQQRHNEDEGVGDVGHVEHMDMARLDTY